MNPHIPHLLAPAGSPDALKAACAAGADAVYLGGRQFGARQFAANFSDDELEEAIRYAHLRGIQVFVTVNTLITEWEIPHVLKYLVFLYRIGVDAVLVQDIGLLSLAHRLIPGLHLHASTQMGVHNVPGALFAAKNGCKRIVLARELSGEEIKTISDACSGRDVDLEIFAHGALCYGYSGRCLFSSLLGGRSGNRGMCAQPCRKHYQFLIGKPDKWGRIDEADPFQNSRYLLSTKDLALYPVLDNIVNLPVAALKIEGRMRSPEYVGTVTSTYRKALDAIQNGTFVPQPEDFADLSIAFSRGFTSGYVSGSTSSEVMGRDYPGNRGYFIGTVLSYRKGKVQVHLNSELIPRTGDGLVIREGEREEGLVLREDPDINGTVVELPSPFKAYKGAQVFITNRKELEKRIVNLLSHPDERFSGSFPISCSIVFSPEGQVFGTGEVRDHASHTHQFTFTSVEQVEVAKTRSLTQDQIREQLNRTGGTLFSFRGISISGEEGWFAPVRVLNALRREILNAAQEAILQSLIPHPDTISLAQKSIQDYLGTIRTSFPKQVTDSWLIVIVSSKSEAVAALQAGADQVYLLWNPLLENIDGLSEKSDRWGIMVPGVIRQNELEAFVHFITINQYSITHRFLVDSVGIGEYLSERFPGSLISSYYGLPIANSAARYSCKEFEFCTLSPELSEQEIRDVLAQQNQSSPDVAICCQGLIEAIVSEDHLCACTTVNKDRSLVIRDEKNYTFPVICEHSGRTHIMNSSEHSLIDEVTTLQNLGIRRYILDARNRGDHYAENMTRLWKKVLQSNLHVKEKAQIREQIVRMSYGGITRSGYRRGLSGMKTYNG